LAFERVAETVAGKAADLVGELGSYLVVRLVQRKGISLVFQVAVSREF